MVQYPVGKTDESYVMLDTVTQIKGGAFGGATNLKNITFSKNLINIGHTVGMAQSTIEGPFAHCENLENVYYNNTIENWIKVNLNSMQISSSTRIVNPMYYAKNFYVLNGNNEYYEQVLRVICMLDNSELKALPITNEKWYEIDDEYRAKIEAMFWGE